MCAREDRDLALSNWVEFGRGGVDKLGFGEVGVAGMAIKEKVRPRALGFGSDAIARE